jgi:predicted metal-binding protein
MSCPPHVAGPNHFRALQKTFEAALVVKIDLPTEILLSDGRHEIMRMLHEIVAGVERSAIEMGFGHAAAFAGSSCKQLFCRDHETCRALSAGGDCRNPQLARPSMSGFGINVSRLMQAAGWSEETLIRNTEAEEPAMSWVAGLVLIR